MKTTQDLLKNYQIQKQETCFRNYRDELVSEITREINALRKGTKWKLVTERTIVILINRNPVLSKNDGEIAYLLKQCREKGSFAKFFWVTKGV